MRAMHRIHAQIAEARAFGSDGFNGIRQLHLGKLRRASFVPAHRAVKLRDLARVSFTESLLDEEQRSFTLLWQVHDFFRRNSLIASFSNVKLATMRFRRAFSSSSARIFFTSSACMPPNFFFQPSDRYRLPPVQAGSIPGVPEGWFEFENCEPIEVARSVLPYLDEGEWWWEQKRTR